MTADTENAADITAKETISQYVFEGPPCGTSGWDAPRGGGVTPFVYGGAGYLRELHEGDALVEEGVEYHAGGGIKWWLGARGRLRHPGRGGFSIRDGGFDFEEKRRPVPVAAGLFIWVF